MYSLESIYLNKTRSDVYQKYLKHLSVGDYKIRSTLYLSQQVSQNSFNWFAGILAQAYVLKMTLDELIAFLFILDIFN